MNQVFLKTRELGEALLNSAEFQEMKAAEERATKNAEAAFNMGKLLECRNRIQNMLETESPDSEQLKALSEEMDAYQDRLNAIEDITRLTEARGQFSALIEQVNSVLRFIVTGEMGQDEGCGTSCASCAGGCGHKHDLN